MLDKIISSIKGELGGRLEQKGLPKEKADEAVGIAKDDIVDIFNREASGGNISGILNLFNGKQDIDSSPVTKSIIGKYAGSLISKLGLDPGMADKIAQYAIPFILSKINNKTPSDGIDKSDLMKMIGGSVTESVGKGMKGKLGGLFGS